MKTKQRIPADDDFCVVVTLVEPPSQLEWCLYHLRLVYPGVPVTVISDGPGHPEYKAICDRFNVRFVLGERLKQVACGGRWWLRTLAHGIEMERSYIFKIDPDTKFHRRIRFWIKRDIFGTISARGTNHEHVQGGVQVFRREAAIRILDSHFFENPRLCNPSSYDWSKRMKGPKRTNYLCSDAMLRAAKKQLKLSWGNWKEVCSRWHYLPHNPSRFALTHPHKRKRLENRADVSAPTSNAPEPV